MAIQKVSIKARTRGKGPKEFTYMGIGKVTERNVTDGDANPIIVDKDGNPIKYVVMGAKVEGKDRTRTLIDGLGVTKDKDGNYILGEGLAFITVHDVDVHGAIAPTQEGMADGYAALAEFKKRDETDTPEQRMADAMALYYNDRAREEAAPTAEEKPDELGPLVAELITAGILTDKSSTQWRRNVSMGADVTGMDKLVFAENTKQVKALRSKAA